jgi:hypothetical protein
MSPRQAPTDAARLVGAIYWSTPLFVALDVWYGISIRIPFLDAAPGAKAAYYALELACAMAMAIRPQWTSMIGYAESMLNISLLVLTTGVAYLGILDSAASPDGLIANPFTPQRVASLVLSATVLAASHVARSASAGPYRSTSRSPATTNTRSPAAGAIGDEPVKSPNAGSTAPREPIQKQGSRSR